MQFTMMKSATQVEVNNAFDRLASANAKIRILQG